MQDQNRKEWSPATKDRASQIAGEIAVASMRDISGVPDGDVVAELIEKIFASVTKSIKENGLY